MEEAVDRVKANLAVMPETKAWQGPAHDAASEMFDRAHRSSAQFSDYTGAIAKALEAGADRIGAARKALLDKADEVDRGSLNVTEGWVVLIDPGSQSAEEISQLMSLVATEQAAVNELLLAVGDADTATADGVMAQRSRSASPRPAAVCRDSWCLALNAPPMTCRIRAIR